MTAIEELRKKLDELGIEWDVSRQARFTDHSVIYESNGIKWIVLESPYSGMLTISNFKDELSLEQVIRATIGEEATSSCDCDNNELLPCPFCGGDSFTVSVDGGIAPDEGLERENARLRELLLDVADVLGKNEKLRELANRLRRAASDGVDNACEVLDENAKLRKLLLDVWNDACEFDGFWDYVHDDGEIYNEDELPHYQERMRELGIEVDG